jgi:hypothetical protein
MRFLPASRRLLDLIDGVLITEHVLHPVLGIRAAAVIKVDTSGPPLLCGGTQAQLLPGQTPKKISTTNKIEETNYLRL